jgi:hypothetical protein
MLVARPPRRNADSRRRRSGHRALRRGPANPACGTRAPSTPCLGARRRARQGLSPSPDSPGSLRSRGAGATPLPVTPASRLARGTGAVDVRLWLGDSLYGLPTIRTPLRPDADVDRVRQDCSPVCPGALAEHAVQDLPESHSLILSEVRDQHAPGQSLHGKEGVDGSSPSEGFRKGPANGPFLRFRIRRSSPQAPADLSPRPLPGASAALRSWLERKPAAGRSTSMQERCSAEWVIATGGTHTSPTWPRAGPPPPESHLTRVNARDSMRPHPFRVYNTPDRSRSITGQR